MEKIDKAILGLAAEYAVASELCRRGVYAQLTLGNHKRTVLLVDVDRGKMLRLQVKAKQQHEWPGVKGVFGPEMVLVLVDYENKKLDERPDFYVILPTDWKSFLQVQLAESGQAQQGQVSLNDELVPTWRGKKRNYVGISVRPEHVQKHKDQWDKIKKLLDPASKPHNTTPKTSSSSSSTPSRSPYSGTS